jgi:hypothetical protein
MENHVDFIRPHQLFPEHGQGVLHFLILVHIRGKELGGPLAQCFSVVCCLTLLNLKFDEHKQQFNHEHAGQRVITFQYIRAELVVNLEHLLGCFAAFLGIWINPEHRRENFRHVAQFELRERVILRRKHVMQLTKCSELTNDNFSRALIVFLVFDQVFRNPVSCIVADALQNVRMLQTLEVTEDRVVKVYLLGTVRSWDALDSSGFL